MRQISQLSVNFKFFSATYERHLYLEKVFWTHLKTLMRYFQLQLMQISIRRRNSFLLRLLEPCNVTLTNLD